MSLGLALGLPYVPQNKPLGAAAPSTAGQPIGLLLILTKAS